MPHAQICCSVTIASSVRSDSTKSKLSRGERVKYELLVIELLKGSIRKLAGQIKKCFATGVQKRYRVRKAPIWYWVKIGEAEGKAICNWDAIKSSPGV